ncbi:MAG: hypothetical protein GXP42_15545 [Chloroflexi bacterium]|nr:hypothetical protein [Chloroflexota bacterium]
MAEADARVLTLPLKACEAAGAENARAIPVAAAWHGLRTAARILDDVEDGHHRAMDGAPHPAAYLINLATGCIAVANLALNHAASKLTPAQRLALLWRFNQTMAVMAGAQHLDLAESGVATADSYWRHVREKSGAFLGLAVQGGALCAMDDEKALARYYEFGYNVGVALQLVNDFNGFFTEEPLSDLALGKRTLPIFFIEEQAPSSVSGSIRVLLARAHHDSDARARIRRIARRWGADVYMVAEILRHHAQARRSLRPSDDPHHVLRRWSNEILKMHRSSLAHQIVLRSTLPLPSS